MSEDSITSKVTFMLAMLMLLAKLPSSTAQLRPDFYDVTCPDVKFIVRNIIQKAILYDPTLPAAFVRQQYDDCFVNGCDASILLDDSATIISEKNAFTTKFGRGYDVIDTIKTTLEAYCPAVVSCADIITMAAETAVSLTGGPSWNVMLGRRDGFTANVTKANEDIASSFSNLDILAPKFFVKGLNLTDLVALSGAHTLGYVHCFTLRPRLYNKTRLEITKVKPSYLEKLRETCPQTGNDEARMELDRGSPLKFDNSYFKKLLINEGILHSDQTLYSTTGSITVDLVKTYSLNKSIFFDDFVQSMIKMTNISPLTGDEGEIRQNCRRVNDAN